MDFPPQSPDVNPIEDLWKHLKREEVKHAVTSKDNLWEIISDCWSNIKAPVLQALVKSMPKRVQAVLKAKGGHTKYSHLPVVIMTLHKFTVVVKKLRHYSKAQIMHFSFSGLIFLTPTVCCMWVLLRPIRLPRQISGLICAILYNTSLLEQKNLVKYTANKLGLTKTKHPDCDVDLGDFNGLNIGDLLVHQNLKQIVQTPTCGEHVLQSWSKCWDT